ncbi:MAG: hypothetical protein HC788_10780, partial [Sphingopyxis sp.]|nr:hypothetical protein [Sphingopyxis sp.]
NGVALNALKIRTIVALNPESIGFITYYAARGINYRFHRRLYDVAQMPQTLRQPGVRCEPGLPHCTGGLTIGAPSTGAPRCSKKAC